MAQKTQTIVDEVRNLATRTQASTREIQGVVERLQAAAEAAAQAMERNENGALATVDAANGAGRSLSSITDAIGRISDMSTQIATAAEEQSSVAEEINRNILSINQISEQTATSSRQTHVTRQALGKVVEQLRVMLRQFGGETAAGGGLH
ncbi:MAG: methyl-accepting chemotaxis protein [Gammaproteobacteria bacterium]